MNMTRNKRDPKKVALAQAIIDAYNPNSVFCLFDTFIIGFIAKMIIHFTLKH